MAVNPMQRKARNSFILGMIVTILLSILVIAVMYVLIIKKQEAKIKDYEARYKTQNIYVLSQSVKSGQILTADMFTTRPVLLANIPSDYADIIATIEARSLTTTDGKTIYTDSEDINGDGQNEIYYYVMIGEKERAKIYKIDEKGQEIVAPYLTVEENGAYYKENNENKKITISSSAVVSKVNLGANTVVTASMITRSEERSTNDLRKAEYNVIALPVELMTDDYVDIRFRLPNGQNYIVVSKKKVTIPMANGEYLADTVQMNLTEKEMLMMSSAIVENAKIDGSMIYATTYTEAGMQKKAVVTYYPSEEIQKMILSNPNIVGNSIEGIKARREEVTSALNAYGNDENVVSKVEESINATQEERKNWLQSLTGTSSTVE